MNGLTLKINRIGNKRSKNTGFDVIVFSDPIDIQDDYKPYFNSILQVTTAEEQLSVIKELLSSSQANCDIACAGFLVDIFLQADAKHPIKCFLTRHITKNFQLQEPFTKKLVCKLSKYIFKQHTDYKQYVEIVIKIAGCTDNFPTGTNALQALELPLIYFLNNSLECCIKTLRKSYDLAPTEKSEIYNLIHLTLRLLLLIIQKLNSSVIELEDIFKVIRSILMDLLFESEVPMDTKSLSGIVSLTIHMLENGPDSWLSFLTNQDSLSKDDAVELALHSAIVIVVPIQKLESEKVCDRPAILVLSDNILKIGERSSSESIFILGVARTVLQLSKLLSNISQLQIGLQLVDELLMFVWTYSEHYMDSVRHLSAQTMACIVKYCNKLRMQGNDKALTQLFAALSTLDQTRRSYFLCVTCLVEEMGSPAVLERLPDVMVNIVQAVKLQAVQASATTALETFIQKHAQGNKHNIDQKLIAPMLDRIQHDDVESTELSVLEGVLVKAVKMDSKVMDLIQPHIENRTHNLKALLTLLSVVRKANVKELISSEPTDSFWKGIIAYNVLKQAAVDSQDEVRILSLSLIVNSPKSTELFSYGDLDLILWFLKYNINAQSPNFRQLFLSILKKFIKRFQDSYIAFKREFNACQDEDNYYIQFVENLRSLCFDCLLQGTNYSRRYVALQILVWIENLQLKGTERIWKESYIEKLLLHLEDSYENNKAMALEVLEHCPVYKLKSKTYSAALDLESILLQASSTKPTDCISAGYKLVLLTKLLPENILGKREPCCAPEAVTYALISILLEKLDCELSICKSSVCDASRRSPMYGLISCLRRCFQLVDTEAISSSSLWTRLISSLIDTCLSVCLSVECVVNNTSPEGHLPMDGGTVDDWGNSKGLALEDGRLVTAQMVLLCAWRSVKEASLLLGDLTSRLSIPETLSYEKLGLIETHFTKLLMNTKHRGAFEQVYVGYTRFLSRIWHCPNSALVSSAQAQLQNILGAIRNKDEGLCATRRSAGLPFMIQALLTTSLTSNSNSKHTSDIISSLLDLARHPDLSIRSHALNVLRALFRSTELTQYVSGFVGDALVIALEGFRSGNWMERNSSTLLFSALMTRTFGVQRSRDSDDLCIRNRMTGRVFFLRYPQLYDYMLCELAEGSASGSQLLRPALYPILLLLARLYPSSLEGTVSNLKLTAFIPHVLSCAGSCVLKTRQLAAKAIVPLVAPDQYISHLESMFELLHDKRMNKNLCHGILLQLTRLLDAKPDCLTHESLAMSGLSNAIKKTCWMVEPEVLRRPCYLIVDEYMKIINLLLWRFPSTLTEQLLSSIEKFLRSLLFTNEHGLINSGRDICLANAVYLCCIIMSKCSSKFDISKQFLYKCLEHEVYEVNLAAMNYLLIAHKSIEPDYCNLQKHLQTINNEKILEVIRKYEYLELLCNILKNSKYLECIRKSLKLLTLQKNTQKYIVAVKSKVDVEITDGVLIEVLFECIENEHESLTHIYLQSLTDFVSEKVQETSLDERLLLKVMWVIFACSSSEYNDEIRSVVVEFLERNFVRLHNYKFQELCDAEKFEFKATLLATIVSTLEDEDNFLRDRTSKIITELVQLSGTKVICSKSGEILREYIVKDFKNDDCTALMVILALLDFKSEVCLTDEINDECRVFDQSERYNIYLEETIWTNACADKIIELCNKTNTTAEDAVVTVIKNKIYRKVINKLCGSNLILFENILSGVKVAKSYALNPKILLFVNRIIR